jgi:hypothetical protein
MKNTVGIGSNQEFEPRVAKIRMVVVYVNTIKARYANQAQAGLLNDLNLSKYYKYIL